MKGDWTEWTCSVHRNIIRPIQAVRQRGFRVKMAKIVANLSGICNLKIFPYNVNLFKLLLQESVEES